MTTPTESLERVQRVVEQRTLPIAEATIEWVAKDPTEIEQSAASLLDELVTILDAHDDVQHVVTNVV